MSNRIISRGLFVALLSVFAAGAPAGTLTTLTLDPSAAASGNVTGNTSTSAPGFGTGSWQAFAMTAGQKSEVYIPIGSLFPQISGPITIADVSSVGYWTNIPGTASSPNWTFYFYTAKTLSGDTGSFYHTRLNSEPYLTNTPSVPSNTWHEWSTNDPNNPMRFYDVARDGDVLGTYSDPTLSTLKTGSVAWPTSGNNVSYGGEDINLVSLQTGSAWAPGFTGLLDGLTITLNNGDIGAVNFEAVTPLPSSLWGGLALLLIVCAFRYWRKPAATE